MHGDEEQGAARRGTVLVVSHPAVEPANQEIYLRLKRLGWDLTLVMPDRWVDDYRPSGWRTTVLPRLESTTRRVPLALAGKPQRHVYLRSAKAIARQVRPDVAFLEQEVFSIPCFQWGRPLRQLGIPVGCQTDENLDRPFPVPARMIRRWSLPRLRFVAARSSRAAEVLRGWGYHGPMAVVPHTVPDFEPQPPPSPDGVFTIGFAGRFVAEKGVEDLLAAAGRLPGPVRVLLVGDGPLRERLARTTLPQGEVEIRSGYSTNDMPRAYREMDVLVLPSRTTPTWAEQFGRVLVEAALSNRPVVGASSGEIPWVIDTIGGGLVYPEGDVAALAGALRELQASPERRGELAARGCRGAREHFGLEAATRTLDALLLSAARSRAA
jgi:glycosyltransferase involved in cell wall biosynthesis